MSSCQLSSPTFRMLGLTLLALLVSPMLVRGEPQTASADKSRSRFDPQRYVEQGKKLVDGVWRLEIVEMLSALAHGQLPDDGKGWFHAGQSRYGWQWLAERYDRDDDGAIVPDEFPPNLSELLARLDRDENGKVEKEDFNWSSDSPYVKQMAQTRRLFSPMDRNRNGQITREEWRDFFDRVAPDGDSITPADLQAALFPPQPPSNDDDPSPLGFLRGFLTGELGSISQGPKIGGRAPDFELDDHEHTRQFRLSQFHGQKPVVLIFGSFT